MSLLPLVYLEKARKSGKGSATSTPRARNGNYANKSKKPHNSPGSIPGSRINFLFHPNESTHHVQHRH